SLPPRMASTEALVPHGLTESDLLELYRRLVLLRTYDERSVVYHRQGRIGTYAIYWNHEAIQAGATYALADDDWIFPSYRESAIGLVRGMPAETILQWWSGHPSGWRNPADWNIASICVPIGTHVPHATTDDPSASIDQERVEEERARECVGQYERFLQRLGLIDDEVVAATRKAAEDLLRAGIAAAEAEPPADPRLVFTHAYVDPPEN